MPTAQSDQNIDKTLGDLLTRRHTISARQEVSPNFLKKWATLSPRVPQVPSDDEDEDDDTYQVLFSLDDDQSLRIGMYGSMEMGPDPEINRELREVAGNFVGLLRQQVYEDLRGAFTNLWRPVWNVPGNGDAGFFGAEIQVRFFESNHPVNLVR